MLFSGDGSAPGCRLEFIEISPGFGRRHVFCRSKNMIGVDMVVSSIAEV